MDRMLLNLLIAKGLGGKEEERGRIDMLALPQVIM